MTRPTRLQLAWCLTCGIAGVVGPFVYFLGPDLRGHLPRLVAVPSMAARRRFKSA